MALPVVLTRECLPAHRADEGALVGVCAQMGPQVVRTGEALRAEGALEGSRMFLDALGISVVGVRRLVLWIGESQDVIFVW